MFARLALQLLPFFLSLAVKAADLSLKSPRVALLVPGDAEGIRHELSLSNPLAETLSLGPADSLKLSFQIVEKGSDQGVQPHQVFLRLYDKKTNEEGILPLRVAANGKVKFDLDMNRPPLALPPTTDDPITVTLLLGSFTHSPAKWHLFDLRLPASQPPPRHPIEDEYHVLPEIAHTFRPDQKSPPSIVSLAFTALVLSPWLGLFVMLSSIPHRLPNLFSTSVLPFILVLGAFEGLLVKYWLHLKLPDVLLYGSILGLVTLGAGKRALTALSKQRLGELS